MNRILEVCKLSVSFISGNEVVQAVNNVSFDISQGEVFALVGETGCGKSVIAHAVTGLLPDNTVISGEVNYKGQDLLELSQQDLIALRGQEIGIILQNPSRALNPLYTIGHQIREPVLVHTMKTKDRASRMVTATLRKMGFFDPESEAHRYPFESSGGMNQRFVIATSTILSPDLLIADEPTTGLDHSCIADVIKEFERIKKEEHCAMILITHDLTLARTLADRIGVMYSGEIVEMGECKAVFSDTLHPYTRGLIGGLPENGCTPIPGISPPMSRRFSGCRFHPRCTERMPICGQVHPRLEVNGDRFVRCHLCHSH